MVSLAKTVITTTIDTAERRQQPGKILLKKAALGWVEKDEMLERSQNALEFENPECLAQDFTAANATLFCKKCVI